MFGAKLSNLGFSGKTLRLIQSMYRNDSLRFLVNGKYTEELYLTQGVKQGKIKVITLYIDYFLFSF